MKSLNLIIDLQAVDEVIEKEVKLKLFEWESVDGFNIDDDTPDKEDAGGESVSCDDRKLVDSPDKFDAVSEGNSMEGPDSRDDSIERVLAPTEKKRKKNSTKL